MKKKYLYLCLFWSVIITVQSCNPHSSISNDISGIKNSDQQVMIRNWKITGPLNGSDFLKDNINQQKYITTGHTEESDENKKTKTIFYHQQGDWTELDELFETQEVGTAYASSEINSNKEQDVGFFMVMDDAVRVWVNGKLAITELQTDYLSKYKFSYKAHLRKGINKIVIKIYNLAKSKWGFNLEVSSFKYVQNNPVSRNYYSISDKYIYQKGEGVILRAKYPDLLNAQKKTSLLIKDIKGNIVLNKRLPLKGAWKLPSDLLKKGIYSFKLSLDNDTLEDHFFIGDISLKINNCISVMLLGLSSYPGDNMPTLSIFIFSIAVLSSTDRKTVITFAARKIYMYCIAASCSLVLSLAIIKRYNAALNWHVISTNYKKGTTPERTEQLYSTIMPELDNDPIVLLDYAHKLYSCGNYLKAIHVLNLAGKYSSNNEIFTLSGNAYEKCSNFPMAEKCYLKSSYLVPNLFFPRYQLMMLYFNTNKLNNAKKWARIITNMPVKVKSGVVADIKIKALEISNYNQNL